MLTEAIKHPFAKTARLAIVQADPACPTADPPKDACNVAVVAQCSSIWHPSHVDLPTLSSYSDVAAHTNPTRNKKEGKQYTTSSKPVNVRARWR